MGLKIGFDMTDVEGRKFYYDDSSVLTSNPPQYRVWYVENVNEQEFIQVKNVFPLKNVPERDMPEVCAALGIPYRQVERPDTTTSLGNVNKGNIVSNNGASSAISRQEATKTTVKVEPIVETKLLPQEETEIFVTGTGNDAPGELTPPKKRRGRPKKTLVSKNGFPHVGGKGSYCPSVKKEDNVELPNRVPDISLEPSKFEYMVVNESMDIADEFTNTLNDYGGEGWELCGFNVYREGLLSSELRVMCIFKRVVR